MNFGRPIVATSAGGIPEAVEDGRTGRVVPARDPEALADALIELLSEESIRESMGRAGRSRFEEHFTAEHMVDATLRLYEERR
jgi:glycosyltransferase involved in cell wall biosynthesis